jgi:hypothetical protein
MQKTISKERQENIIQLAQLAMESEMSQPIDWANLSINKEEAFMTMASNVLEQIESLPEEQQPVVALATITKLLVENFALNLIMQKEKNV